MLEYPARIGLHEVSVQDDELFIRFVGFYSPDEARQVLGLVSRILDEKGRVFFVMDVAAGEMPGPETRRILANEFPRHPRLFTISVNMALIARTGMRLIEAAQRITGRRTTTNLHFASLAEARAFIDKERERLQ